MKHLFFALLILSSSLTLNGQVRTEKRTTNSFSELSLRVFADLYLIQGNESSIEISGDDASLDRVIVEVSNNKLIIRFSIEDRFLNNFKPGKLIIKVSTPTISEISIQGSGNVFAEQAIDSHKLDLSIAGSGNIRLKAVNCNRLQTSISGSGDIYINEESSTKEVDINIAGSGDALFPALTTEAAYVVIAGSGNCDVSVSHYLDAKIFGSGDIKYHGSPNLKSSITGSGRIYSEN